MSAPLSPIFVRPNRNTLGLAAVLAAMWYAGAGQNNGAAYLLCFTIAGLAAVSSVHVWANLRKITLRVGPIAPVFAGDKLVIPLHASGQPGRRHASISATSSGADAPVAFPEFGETPEQAQLYVKAARRGGYESVTVRLFSLYPLGFFTARQTTHLKQAYFIYPAPVGIYPLPAAFDPGRESNEGERNEGDDFAGVREWRAGESMRHVDWKAVARGQAVMIKQWSGVAGDLLILDWDTVPQLAVEERLSQLSQWAVTAEKNGATYGLRLPGVEIEPARGEAHFHACMRALASFEAAGAVDTKEAAA